MRRLTRRELLALGAAAGAVGLRIAAAEEPKAAGAPTASAAGTAAPVPAATPPGAPLSAYLLVGRDDRIHLILPVTEMGQGVSTSFAAQVAAEFGFPKATDVRVDQAPIGVAYMSPGSLLQSTAASTSVRVWHLLVGDAARRMRAMLTASAASQLRVAESDVTLEPQYATVPRRGAQRRARVPLGKLEWQDETVTMSRSFGRLAAGQGRVAPATNVHAGEIADGTLKYGIDQQRPNQLHAAVRCNPAAGAGVRRFDESAIRRREGVVDVVPVPDGIAILANSWWTAHRSLQDAAIEWQPGTGSSESLEAELRRQLETGPVLAAPPQLATAEALSAARAVVSRDYFVPMLAHAALEPLACTAEFVAGRCQLWMGTQSPQLVARDVARALDLPYESIDLHNFPMGGSFGRRVIGNEVAIQAALLARHSCRPVKVLWDREEDLRHDRFRPAIVARLSASLDAAHKPVTLTARVCGADWLDEVGNSRPQVKALTNTQGLATSPYAFRGVDAGFIEAKSPVPVGPWRSIAHGFNVFFLETFIDELAALAAADPIDFRHSLLAADSPGHAVLRAVRARCGWDSRRSASPDATRAGWGVSLQFGWDTWIATVARLEQRDDELRVTDVWAALDCGVAVNPPGVIKQIEGGVLFGLTAALYGRVDYQAGAPSPRNFVDYRLLRLSEAPRVDVQLLASQRSLLCGIGEAGTSAIMPAIGNAASALRGERARSLPLVKT